MRSVILLVAATCWAQTAAEKGVVTGRVVSAMTGAPLKNASVWLASFTPTPVVNEAPSVPAVATDAEGRFTLPAVEPGDYVVIANHAAHLQRVAAPFALAAGATKSLELQLMPQSLVCGKVVDQDGDAIPSATVSVRRFDHRGRLAEVRSAMARDDGSFVVGGLAPGRYYVRAAPLKPAVPQGGERLVATDYPDAVDVPAASAIGGIEVRMRTARVFRVRGRVLTSEAGSLAGNFLIRYSPGDDWASVAADPNGAFTIDGLVAGTYTISTDPVFTDFLRFRGEPRHSGPTLFGSAGVTVAASDIENVVLPVARGAELTVNVSGGRASVALEGSDGSSVWHNGPAWGQLRPDRYIVHAIPGEAGTYVKSIRFAGAALENAVLDLPSGASGRLEIELAHDGGRVSGVTAPGALVQLWPMDGGSALAVRANARGEFHFDVVAPGDYRAHAWEFSTVDPDECPASGNGERIHVDAHGNERVDLAAAKMPK